MIMSRQALRLMTVAAFIALPSMAVYAAPKPEPAPILDPNEIPSAVPGESTGLLDIDFRHWPDPSGASQASLGLVTVSAGDNTLVQNDSCTNGTSGDADQPDGFGIDSNPGDGVCDGGIEKGEILTVTVSGADGADGTAAFDVDGIWLTDFVPAKNGEAGVIELTGIRPSDSAAFSFSWKDVEITTVPDNGEFFVGFGRTIRMTQAVITATSGSFSVAGFSQQPVVINDDECIQDGVNSDGCHALIAQGVYLDLLPKGDLPGDRGVTGQLFKEGVYVVQDTRSTCPGDEELPVDLDGDGDIDLTMREHQCGYGEPIDGNPLVRSAPVFYVLDLDGSNLTIAEDTIEALFDDEATAPGDVGPDTYSCWSTDPTKRPAVGWLSRNPPAAPPFEELPLFAPDGSFHRVHDVTIGPCGSGRGGFTKFSYVVYHWVNSVTTPFDPYPEFAAIIGERIDQLQAYVDTLFPCVQQGINQSTFSDDTGHIKTSFSQGRYQRALDYVAEMRANVLSPRILDEISAGQCFFDLTAGVLQKDPPGVPANVVGNLLVQLDHLDWMIYSVFIGSPEDYVEPPRL